MIGVDQISRHHDAVRLGCLQQRAELLVVVSKIGVVQVGDLRDAKPVKGRRKRLVGNGNGVDRKRLISPQQKARKDTKKQNRDTDKEEAFLIRLIYFTSFGRGQWMDRMFSSDLV